MIRPFGPGRAQSAPSRGGESACHGEHPDQVDADLPTEIRHRLDKQRIRERAAGVVDKAKQVCTAQLRSHHLRGDGDCLFILHVEE